MAVPVPVELTSSEEVEETMERIQAHKGIIGTILTDNEGTPVKTTMDNTTTVQYVQILLHVCEKTRSIVRDLDPTNDLTFLRIRTKTTEIMVAPDPEFMLIVIQTSAET